MTTKKAHERYQNFSNEEKKVTLWSWAIQKSTRRWNSKSGWVYKKYYKMRKSSLL